MTEAIPEYCGDRLAIFGFFRSAEDETAGERENSNIHFDVFRTKRAPDILPDALL